MPPLVCPSPIIIDLRSVEDAGELHALSRALGYILDGVSQGRFSFLLTEPLRSFIRNCDETFDWTKIQKYKRLQTIYEALVLIGSQPSGVESVDLSKITGHTPHPLPEASKSCPSAPIWADEVGRVCFVHDACMCRPSAFIGVGCTSALSGGELGEYENPEGLPHLPLVGPTEISSLGDSLVWEVRPEWANRAVTFDEVWRNVHLVGGEVCKAKGTSHNQVKFKGDRTWPLSSNFREMPEQYIQGLAQIAGMDIAALKFTLCEGRMPPKRNRLKVWLSANLPA